MPTDRRSQQNIEMPDHLRSRMRLLAAQSGVPLCRLYEQAVSKYLADVDDAPETAA